MTNKIFFDTDCLSAFLWVRKENLLLKLYDKRIILPKQVYIELSHPRIPQLKSRIDSLKQSGNIIVESIEMNTTEYHLYYKLINKPENWFKVIGKGEAAAIALAKVRSGILASNNMKDIQGYVQKYKLEHITTGSILCNALKQGYITEEEGNNIWTNMLAKRRLLPCNSFTEYLSNYKSPQS